MNASFWRFSARFVMPSLVVSIVLVAGGCQRQASPFLVTPVQALEYLAEKPAKVVYFNGAAHAALVAANPPWLDPADREVRSERVRAMAQAVQTPKLFRQLDRQQHFDALILTGDSQQYKPLMDHLIKSGDWALEWVDAFCLIYRRGKQETLSMERIRSVTTCWEGLPKSERAMLLAAMAENLVAARRGDAAREMLDVGMRVAPDSPAVWVSEGRFRLARGEWKQAIAAADRALKADKEYRPAWSVKAQGLYFSKRFQEAYALSARLLKDAQEDPLMLFSHAKIAHEVRALEEEILVLRKLIDIAERQGRQTSWYRIYLGQAFGLTGDGEGAERELGAALQDPELPEEQREFASDALARVRSKVRVEASEK